MNESEDSDIRGNDAVREHKVVKSDCSTAASVVASGVASGVTVEFMRCGGYLKKREKNVA